MSVGVETDDDPPPCFLYSIELQTAGNRRDPGGWRRFHLSPGLLASFLDTDLEVWTTCTRYGGGISYVEQGESPLR